MTWFSGIVFGSGLASLLILISALGTKPVREIRDPLEEQGLVTTVTDKVCRLDYSGTFEVLPFRTAEKFTMVTFFANPYKRVSMDDICVNATIFVIGERAWNVLVAQNGLIVLSQLER